MNRILILGSDTDVGKTVVSMLWLAAFRETTEYWKPIESGDSDSKKVSALIPEVVVHPPLLGLSHALAPALAAKLEGIPMPSVEQVLLNCPEPSSGTDLVIESFGSPFSPYSDELLQIDLIRKLGCPSVLVVDSSIGAIGRGLQSVVALRKYQIFSQAIVLCGEKDSFAEQQLALHANCPVYSLTKPKGFSVSELQASAKEQLGVLRQLKESVFNRKNESFSDIKDWLLRDETSVWHPYSPLRNKVSPLLVEGAKDEFLELADGRKVIDSISSWWTILWGHRDPILMTALAEASESFDHVVFAGLTHRPAIELAELMLSSVIWEKGRVFFSDDGSTAVEVALKLAYQYWCHCGESQRTKYICFENGYHGDTFGAMSIGRDEIFFGRFKPLMFAVEQIPIDVNRLNDCLTANKGQIAAVIIEPLVQGAGGMRMHSAETLKELALVCKQHDVLLIVDEVMTGGGRTGTLWAHSQAGIIPDLICAGKTIAGGILPIAATLVGPRIVDSFDSEDPNKRFFHGHSFTAHPLACAVGVANWRKLVTGLGEGPKRINRFWTDSFAQLLGLPQVSEIRVCGTIAAISLTSHGGYLSDVGRKVSKKCLEKGVFIRPLGDVVYVLPPFCISNNSLEVVLEAIKSALDSIQISS